MSRLALSEHSLDEWFPVRDIFMYILYPKVGCLVSGTVYTDIFHGRRYLIFELATSFVPHIFKRLKPRATF